MYNVGSAIGMHQLSHKVQISNYYSLHLIYSIMICAVIIYFFLVVGAPERLE